MIYHYWLLLWTYGWLGFIGALLYSVLGAIVFFNGLKSSSGSLRFFRFFFFSLVCGPLGWFCFPFWFLYKACSLIDIDDIGKWLSRSNS